MDPESGHWGFVMRVGTKTRWVVTGERRYVKERGKGMKGLMWVVW